MSCAQGKESLLSFKAKSLKLLLPSVEMGVWMPGGPVGTFGHLCRPRDAAEARKPRQLRSQGWWDAMWDYSGRPKKTPITPLAMREGDTRAGESRSTSCTQYQKPTDHVSWTQRPPSPHRVHTLPWCPSVLSPSQGVQEHHGVPLPPRGTRDSCLTFTGGSEEVTAS